MAHHSLWSYFLWFLWVCGRGEETLSSCRPVCFQTRWVFYGVDDSRIPDPSRVCFHFSLSRFTVIDRWIFRTWNKGNINSSSGKGVTPLPVHIQREVIRRHDSFDSFSDMGSVTDASITDIGNNDDDATHNEKRTSHVLGVVVSPNPDEDVRKSSPYSPSAPTTWSRSSASMNIHPVDHDGDSNTGVIITLPPSDASASGSFLDLSTPRTAETPLSPYPSSRPSHVSLDVPPLPARRPVDDFPVSSSIRSSFDIV